MENNTSTIAALATAPGIGGIAVIRISGSDAFRLCGKIFFASKGENPLCVENFGTHTAHYGKIRDITQSGSPLIDTVVLTVFRSPHSFTGEDTVEISCHGGNLVSSLILDLLYKIGASPATAGEFTKRAFLNGKMDLMQAEAVADLINALSVPTERAAARISAGDSAAKFQSVYSKIVSITAQLETELDFLDDNISLTDHQKIADELQSLSSYCTFVSSKCRESEILRSGYSVAVVGFPNSGKSTLFNSLLDRNRSIVSTVPGTTRDYIEEIFYINQFPFRLTDTAGLHSGTTDQIEAAGIKLVSDVLAKADLILLLNDITKGAGNSTELFNILSAKYTGTSVLLVQNKTDKILPDGISDLCISAKYGTGIDKLKEAIYKFYVDNVHPQDEIFINKRHAVALDQCAEELGTASYILLTSSAAELAIINLRSAAAALGLVTGQTFSAEILDEIFSKFCIGK